jgi:hypothetical protein
MKRYCMSAVVFFLFPLAWGASAQTLKVQVFDGKNGMPLANQRVVLMGDSDSGGIRQVGDFHTQSDGTFQVSSTTQRIRSLDAYVEGRHLCSNNPAKFSFQQIISTGVVSENSCKSKLQQRVQPRTLVLYVRDETFFEKMAH